MECVCFQLLFFPNNYDKRDFAPSLLFLWAFVDSKLCAALWVGIIVCYILSWPLHWFPFPEVTFIFRLCWTRRVFISDSFLVCLAKSCWCCQKLQKNHCVRRSQIAVGSEIPVLWSQAVLEPTFEAFSFPVSDLHFRYSFQLLETLKNCDTTTCWVTPLWSVYLTVITSVYKG